MKYKKIVIAGHAALQTFFLLGFVGGLFLAEYTGNPEVEYIPVISFIGFATVQLVGTATLCFFYQEKRARTYLESVLYVQVCGTAIAGVLGLTELDVLMTVAGVILLFAWIIAPLFQAMWCLGLSWSLVGALEDFDEYV